MAKRKTHVFHCSHCDNACMIYKKGKAHRVLVCPKCGVLATNPFSLTGALKGVGKTIPVASQVIGAIEGGFSNTPTISKTPHLSINPRRNIYKDYIDLEIAKELSNNVK